MIQMNVTPNVTLVEIPAVGLSVRNVTLESWNVTLAGMHVTLGSRTSPRASPWLSLPGFRSRSAGGPELRCPP